MQSLKKSYSNLFHLQNLNTLHSPHALVFQLLIVLAAVVAVILYRLAILPVVATAVDSSGLGGKYSNTFTSLLITTTATMISLVLILVLNKVLIKHSEIGLS